MEKCAGWKEVVINGFKLTGISSNTRHRVLLTNQLETKGELNHWTLWIFTHRFSSKCSLSGNPWVLSSLGRSSLKFSWVVLMMSQTGFIAFMMYSVGIWVHLLFSLRQRFHKLELLRWRKWLITFLSLQLHPLANFREKNVTCLP